MFAVSEVLTLLSVTIFAASIVAPFTAKRPSTCFSAGLLLIFLASLDDLHAGHLGTLITSTVFAGIIPFIYWTIAGHKNDAGRLRTSRIFFWMAFILPAVMYIASHLRMGAVAD